MGTIEILDAISSKADRGAKKSILPCFEYQYTYWQRSEWGMKKNVKTGYLITGHHNTGGTFHTGLLTKIKKHCKKNKIDIDVIGEEETLKPNFTYDIDGITFRKDQRKALRRIKRKSRGIILFPTGTGKTIIALGVMQMFKDRDILFLCHTKDLITQTHDELVKYGFKNIFIIGAGSKTTFKKIYRTSTKVKGTITLATIQSFVKIKNKNRPYLYDVTIVDEVHHVVDKFSQYGEVMELNLSPRRYGFTATLPTDTKKLLINEGLFGPVIAKLTYEKAKKLGLLVKTKLNLLPVQFDDMIDAKCSNYAEYYKYAIIENQARNQFIKNSIKKNEITLVIVEKVKHGEILSELLNAPFVYGKVAAQERSRIKNEMKDGKLKLAICSRVWNEGINIPSLNHIINAAGMKDEKAVIQKAGRGLRTADGKAQLKLTDFLDPYPYLSSHTVLRLQVYAKQEWL